MPVLTSSKHEKFAQLAASGVSATKAYVSAGYSKANARQNASRLITNDNVLARIKELQTAVAERVVASEIRRRNWRVEVLQQRVEGMLALSAARAKEYAEFPAGKTGMLVKDYRGKNAEQVIWKFDAALVAQINDTLTQARSPTRAATSSTKRSRRLEVTSSFRGNVTE
jgi:hypothetical protein